MKIDQNLNEIFDIETSEVTDIDIIDTNGDVIPISNTTDKEQLDADYDKTRNNLYSLLESGKTALEDALLVARSSEDPKAFDAVSKLLVAVTSINNELLETHLKKQKLSGIAPTEQPAGSTTNNAIFVGTTSELKQLLKDMKK